MKYGNSREIEEMVCDGTIAFGVIGKKSEASELCSQMLCKDEMVIAIPATGKYKRIAVSKNSREKKLALLLSSPVILREDGSGTKLAAEKLLEENGGGNIIMRSNDQEAIKHMVACGAGVSLMSAYAASDMVESGKIFTLPITAEAPRSFYIITKRDSSLRPCENRYIELARSIYGS